MSSLSQALSRLNRQFTEKFYADLLSQYSRFQRTFQYIDIQSQSAMLTVGLKVLVHWHRYRTPACEIYLKSLGQKHDLMGIDVKDYHEFGEVLLDSMADFLGQHWNQSLANEWREVFSDGVNLMLEGSKYSGLSVNHLPLTAEMLQFSNIEEEQIRCLHEITTHINRGVTLKECLNHIYNEFQEIIPYNRIGFALIEGTDRKVVAKWAKSDRSVLLGKEYSARLAGSTLAEIVETGHPRVINNLQEYLRLKPSSHSTRLIVKEGMRSSLTCPLIAEDKPIGFL
jgi:hemoglobin-like flavoprotein